MPRLFFQKFVEAVADVSVDMKGHSFKLGADRSELHFGSAGDDLIVAYGGNDAILAGAGDDVLIAMDGNTYLNGGSGHDILIGGSGRDRLVGGDGDDRLVLGDGDLGRGDSGADAFVFGFDNADAIQISDFDAAEGDTLEYARPAGGFTVEDTAKSAVIRFEDGGSLELFGYTVADVMDDPGLFGL